MKYSTPLKIIGAVFILSSIYVGHGIYKADREIRDLTARTKELRREVAALDSQITGFETWIDTLDVIIRRGIMPPVITTPIKKI